MLVEFWLTGTHLGAVADTEGRDRADRQDVPRPHDGKLRIRPGTASIICERPITTAAVVTALGIG
jgi:hypothetical protein